MSYDIERFRGKVHDDIKCLICHNVPKIAKMGPCEHMCCLNCISTWLESSNVCPGGCGSHITAEQLKPPGRILQNLINSLEIQCDNSERGCEEYIPLDCLELHTKSCPKGLTLCQYQGCNAEFPREAIAEHEATCAHRVVRCNLCNTDISVAVLQQHVDSDCPGIQIECDCGSFVRRGDLSAHLAEACANGRVRCPVTGCTAEMQRKDMPAHMHSELYSHFITMCETVSTMQHQITGLVLQTKELHESMRTWRYTDKGTCIFRLSNMTARMQKLGDKLLTPCWFTDPDGYCFRLHLNFDVPGKNAGYVGVFLKLEAGDNDGALAWPFTWGYSFTIGHVTKTVERSPFNLDTFTQYGRAPWKEGWGFGRFCSVDEIRNFVHDECLVIEVSFMRA
eukprot:TRINITY_DN68401_c0_g1_i1.p1 TRINITY_DN68401_c0_g1~~TRINITY_DN68401_c0_g1_i1.p1  ORF type:complete len:393 (-),score=49.51 TRINITY_DN68401_c0_g1_i1:98-1276(-)